MITAVITNTRPQRVFSSVQTCVLVDVNQPLPWFFTLGLERIPSPFLEHSEEYVGVSAIVALFCYRIWHRFMSRLREEYEFVECFQRKLKLSTYLHTVGYNHISFLNTRSQLVWVLASSGFYSITWRMISRSACRLQNSFSKTTSVRRKPLSLVGVIPFVSLNLCSLAIRPRLPWFHTIK